MTFKDFYLVQERTYFFDVGEMTDNLIQQLQQKISEKDEVKSGDTFTLAIDDTHDVDVKFLKRLSKAARQYKKEGESISAMYFPETYDSNGRVEIYINPSKKSVGYYKERTFEDFVNKSLPKYIKDLLRHEFTHAIEDIIKDTLQHGTSYEDFGDYSEYRTSPHEITAHLISHLKGIVESDKLLQYHLLQRNLKNATLYAAKKLRENGMMEHLDATRQQKVLRNIFDFLQTIIDKAAQRATMM